MAFLPVVTKKGRIGSRFVYAMESRRDMTSRAGYNVDCLLFLRISNVFHFVQRRKRGQEPNVFLYTGTVGK